MNSQEADRFMSEHPEVAVKVFENGTWVAWDYRENARTNRSLGVGMDTAVGLTREQAIKNYRDEYHPEKPIFDNPPAVMQGWVSDSRKYRKIIELYRCFVNSPSPAYEDIRRDNFIFTSKLWEVIEDDYHPHCKECNQEVKS